MEQVAQLHQPRRLEPGGDVGGAAVVHRVVRHHTDRVAVDPGQPGDPGPAVQRGDREERALVDDELDEPLGVVHPARLAGHERRQRLVATVDRIGRLAARRHLVDARRQVREELADHRDRLLLGAGEVVDDAAHPGVDLRAAELLLGDVDPERRLDDRRAAREHLGVVDHHVPVGEVGVQRTDAGGRAHHGRHDRHRVQQRHVDVGEAVGVRAGTCGRSPRSCARCRRRRRAAGRTAAATRAPAATALSSSPRPPPCPLPEPPRTVKSPAVTTTLRPSMRHIPSTLPCGRERRQLAVLVVACPGRAGGRTPGTSPGRRAAGAARGRSACRGRAGGRCPPGRPCPASARGDGRAPRAPASSSLRTLSSCDTFERSPVRQ